MRSKGHPDPDQVRVLDTSCLIRLKRLLPITEQWAVLMQMTALIDSGHIAFPRQVVNEMKAGAHPDAPGVWAAGNKGWVWHGLPQDESVAEAMGAAQLTDPTDETDVADPYVVAMALEIIEAYPQADVVVVTEDRVDRMPVKEALATACQRLEIADCSTQDFIDWLKARRAAR